MMMFATTVIHNGCPVLPCIFQQPGKIFDLTWFRHRCETYTVIPGHSGFKFFYTIIETFYKLINDASVYEQYFQGSTTLSIERKRTRDTLTHGIIKISIRQDNGWIFRIETKDRL